MFPNGRDKEMARIEKNSFQFKQFTVNQERCAMKVGIDGVLLGAWSTVEGRSRALDIGTGTGLIALMVAQRNRSLQVDAIDIDEAAAGQAQENVAASPFTKQIMVHSSAIQEFATQSSEQRYDLIVSNPPFFTGGVLSSNQNRASVRHTVKLSHQDLLRSVQYLLTSDGSFCLILPLLEGLRFKELAASYQLQTVRQMAIHPRPGRPANRLLLELKKGKEVIKESSMTLYAEEEGNAWSLTMQQLTQAFYLKL